MRPNSQALKHRSSHDTEREFGGALGLFLGFSFMMLWDGVVLATEGLQKTCKKKPRILEYTRIEQVIPRLRWKKIKTSIIFSN